MTIYDGDSNTSSIMGKYCGDSIPPVHVSSSNEILIHFQSDGHTTGAGFQIEYKPTGNQEGKDMNVNVLDDLEDIATLQSLEVPADRRALLR